MVNWSTFESLPGSANYNFEMLCRALVWLSYSRYGSFKALLNQPGVEFDLKLEKDCELGENGSHFGWQCRWYELAKGSKIGKTRRDKIKEAVEKTIKNIPGLTDWVLWTRHTLTKDDQDWFFSLNGNIKLHLWSSIEAEMLLNTNGEKLKLTYFGDLVLTPEHLLALHNQSVAPIIKRWFPEVHQIVDAERSVKKMLGDSWAWDELYILSNSLKHLNHEMQHRTKTVPTSLLTLTNQFMICLESYATQLSEIFNLLKGGDFVLIKGILNNGLKGTLREISSLPRKLRGAKLQIGVIATNAMADLKDAERLIAEVSKFLNTRLVGIVADAGSGKTQLSATLTAPKENKPAGVLLLGRFLNRQSSLDDLARKIVINGKPMPSMEALIMALDAAAERAKCILPLVIDGLNEAEDPREWKPLLSSLQTLLAHYPNVLIICTLRSGAKKKRDQDEYYYTEKDNIKPFVEYCLPENTLTFEIPDFGNDVRDAMQKYFSFFKIEAIPEVVYSNYLRHPLTLRIFCEVTNPTREKAVGMEAIPRSLAALFEKYIELAAIRIEELSPHYCRYHQGDINNHLDKFGFFLWTSHSRAINERQFRIEIGDDRNPWNNSAINFMEQEGLLLRMPGKLNGLDEIVPTYDLLGGYLIAKYIISQNGRDTIAPWLKTKRNTKALSHNYSFQHPLRDDIFRFLVALLPKYHNIQLWEVIGLSMKNEAIELALLLEPKYLNKATIDKISNSIKKSKPEVNRFFGKLLTIRDSEKHPLNSLFIDQVLSDLTPGERDLIWSEWLRRNEEGLQSDLDNIIKKWSNNSEKKYTSDNLIARWFMWMLTTTSNKLRYKVTFALYWFGRNNSKQLFDLTIRSISINDPYIPERMLAASYGVAMALVTVPNNEDFCKIELPNFAKQIYNTIFSKESSHFSTHILIINYSIGIIELAQTFNTDLFNNEELKEIYGINEPTLSLKRSKSFNKKLLPGESPFGMDFENYIIGRLVVDRQNYDFKHRGFQKIRSQILWRIFNLGWSFKNFGTIDRSIQNHRQSLSRHDDSITKIERYGKKYSWIAFYEQKGKKFQFANKDKEIIIDRRESETDIDPSFPIPPNGDKIINKDFLGNSEITLNEWIKNGIIPDFSEYFEQKTLNGSEGPWILLDGHFGQEDENRGRSMFGFIRSFLVAKNQEKELLSLLKNQKLGGRWLPEKSQFNYVYAGEIPWASLFDEETSCNLEFELSEKIINVPEEIDVTYLDGIKIELSFADSLRLSGIDLPYKIDKDESRLSEEDLHRIQIKKEVVLVKKVIKEIKKIEVIQPVCDVRTIGKTLFESSTNGYTLNKRFFKILKLNVIPQTRDLQTLSGERVTFQNSYNTGSFKNSEGLYFLRKDLLDTLLDKLGMSLVWAVWGERELSIGQFETWDRKVSDGNLPYADFQQVHAYSLIQKFE